MTHSHVLYLDAQRLGRRVLIYDRTDSTNDRAAELATDPANDGVVILAREQTAGRGQHGRTWTAPGESSVLMSVLLFPPAALRRPALLTAWAAVSVCETIRELTDLQAKIKWPNDVLIRGRKVCGILIEQRVAGVGEPGCVSTRVSGASSTRVLTHPGSPTPATYATITGIGLNVNQSAADFAASGLDQAASLTMFTGQSFDCETVARQLLAQLDEEYDRLHAGDLSTLESCWQWRLGLLGRQVIAECHDVTHLGRLRELGWDGVVLETDAGLIQLLPETIRHLSEQSR